MAEKKKTTLVYINYMVRMMKMKLAWKSNFVLLICFTKFDYEKKAEGMQYTLYGINYIIENNLVSNFVF